MHTEEKQCGSPDLEYEELFGAPALDPDPEHKSPYEVGNPSDTPPDLLLPSASLSRPERRLRPSSQWPTDTPPTIWKSCEASVRPSKKHTKRPSVPEGWKYDRSQF
jgi:hypothetical protein